MKPYIESITIVGGGTAGWLSALYLQRTLPKNLKITLVESSDVPTVGVGESTLPTIVETIKFLGIDEAEFLRETNGTFKGAINFVDWEHNPGTSKERNNWYHPFFPRHKDLVSPYQTPHFPYIGQGYSLTHYWQYQKVLKNQHSDYDMTCFLTPHLCEDWKLPKHPGCDSAFRYAYHVDAGLLANFFRKIGLERGIEHKVAHVSHVNLDDDGSIASLDLKTGETISSDFFIDCTGFYSLLIEKTLKQKFISDNKTLFCNAAVAIQTKNPEKEKRGIRSFTTSTAIKNGWVWEVPLFHRNGTGYVYCKDFITPDQAETELREFLGEQAEGMPAKHIKEMRVGKMEKLWYKNCLAVGLSGAFLEPLEATSIVFTELQLATFVNLFPTKNASELKAKKYNKIMEKYYVEVRDFIALHYFLSKRTDSDFWLAVQKDTLLPESLKEKLALHRENFFVMDDLIEFNIFTSQSYHCLFAGMNYLPEDFYPPLHYIENLETGFNLLNEMQKENMMIAAKMPDHYEYLKEIHQQM